MQEIGRALRFAETRGPARQRGCRGSERGTARRGTRRWPRRGNAGARCTHARERTWIKIIGCYGDGRQMMLFADSLMAPCQIMRCCGNSSSGPASSSLQLQLSERYSEEKKKYTCSYVSAVRLRSREESASAWHFRGCSDGRCWGCRSAAGFRGSQSIAEPAQPCWWGWVRAPGRHLAALQLRVAARDQRCAGRTASLLFLTLHCSDNNTD